MQAPVKALDPHGLTVVTLGTIAFAVGALVCWWQLDALAAIGKGWWLTSALIGLGIGVLALVVLLARRARQQNRSVGPDASSS